MTRATMDDVRTWKDSTVLDSKGDRIGKVEDVYFDEQTGKPEWALVNTGMLGTKHNFVPLFRARTIGENVVQIPFTETQVKDAPAVESGQELSQGEEKRLYDHYGIDWRQSDSETVLPADQQQGAQTVRRPQELTRLGGLR